MGKEEKPAKMKARGERLQEVFDAGPWEKQIQFAIAIDVPQPHVSGYFKGERDVASIAEKLFRAGLDVRYIITGERSSDVVLSIEDRRILSELKSHNLGTLGAVLKMIKLYEAAYGETKEEPKLEPIGFAEAAQHAELLQKLRHSVKEKKEQHK